MIKILLADDHAIIRQGLRIFISDYFPASHITESADGDDALEKIMMENFNLIILDVNMPGTNSFELVSKILAHQANANILIFSMNAEDVYAKKYLQMGVRGYLSKASNESEMEKALSNVINGKRYLSPGVSDILTESALGNIEINPFNRLSSREFEIMLMLTRGKSLVEICKALSLHPSTVGTHKARLFQKLNCDNIIDIHALAQVYNVIPAS